MDLFHVIHWWNVICCLYRGPMIVKPTQFKRWCCRAKELQLARDPSSDVEIQVGVLGRSKSLKLAHFLGVVILGVSLNGGTPKSSILIGISITNHPFWGATILEHPYWGEIPTDPNLLPALPSRDIQVAGDFKYSLFWLRNVGKWSNLTRSSFQMGWVKPPTSIFNRCFILWECPRKVLVNGFCKLGFNLLNQNEILGLLAIYFECLINILVL